MPASETGEEQPRQKGQAPRPEVGNGLAFGGVESERVQEGLGGVGRG